MSGGTPSFFHTPLCCAEGLQLQFLGTGVACLAKKIIVGVDDGT